MCAAQTVHVEALATLHEHAKSPLVLSLEAVSKLSSSKELDTLSRQAAMIVRCSGWRLLTIWEYCLRGSARRSAADVLDYCTSFIRGEAQKATLAGTWPEGK